MATKDRQQMTVAVINNEGELLPNQTAQWLNPRLMHYTNELFTIINKILLTIAIADSF